MSQSNRTTTRECLQLLRTSSSAAALALAVMMVSPSTAYAQDSGSADTLTQAPPPGSSEDDTADDKTAGQALLEEIVVTARKREEAAQDVPVAISAFGGAQLDALQVRDVLDLSASIPNVRFDAGASPGVAFFSIRGLGINSSIPTVDPSVGTFIDGIYIGTSYGVVLDSFDLAAIEVLRGPQGLLFGRNVTGGAVLLRSRRPSVGEGISGRAKISLETGPLYTVAGSVEFPLGSKAAGKITGYYAKDAGYFENDLDGSKDLGENRLFFVRPTLVFEPTETLDFAFILEHGKAEGDGTVLQNTRDYDKFNLAIDEEGALDLEWTQATVEANLKVGFGDGTITNLFGYRTVEHIALSDFDGGPTDLFHAIFGLDQEQYSNELRYSGTFFGDRLDLTTGLYFFTQDLLYRERRRIRGGVVDSSFGGDQQQDTYGAFLSGDFKVLPTLTVTLGARYSHEKKDAQVASFVGARPTCNRLELDFKERTCRFNFTGSRTYKNVTPKIGLTWEPNPNLLIYGSATRGYRSGGFNVRNTSVPQSSGPTDDESQDAYEIGVKAQLFDRRLRLNGAVFFTQISDLQRETNIADPAVGVIQALRNTADADIAGVEIDGVALLTDNFSIDFAAGYQDGKYTRIIVDLNGDRVINQADLDLEIPRLGKVSLNIGANLDVPVAVIDGDLGFRVSYSYQDKSAFTDNNSAFLRSANLVNGSIKYSPSSKGFSLSVYGKNLLDEAYEGTNAPTPFGGFRSLNKGRVLGVEAAITF